MTPLLILTMRLAWLSQFLFSRWPHFSYLQWGWHGWVCSHGVDDPTSHTYNEAGMAESVLTQQMSPLLILTVRHSGIYWALYPWPDLDHLWVVPRVPCWCLWMQTPEWHLLDLFNLGLTFTWSYVCCFLRFHADVCAYKFEWHLLTSLTLAWPWLDHLCVIFQG